MKIAFLYFFVFFFHFSNSYASETKPIMNGSAYFVHADGSLKLLKSEVLAMDGPSVEFMKSKEFSVWCNISSTQPSSTYQTWEGLLCRTRDRQGQTVGYPVVGYFPWALEKGAEGAVADSSGNHFFFRFERKN